MKARVSAALTLAALGIAFSVSADEEGTVQVTKYTMKDIDGREVDLGRYQGKVLLLVNVASKCGLTPQYTQLVEIHQKYRDRGFEVLGFPANNFMGQEPGTNEEIKTFCSTRYGVEFPIFSKISVKGDDIDPLYAELTSSEANGGFGGEIKWNFTKFLVGKDGKVIARFEPQVKPDAPEVVSAIEAAITRQQTH
jgi:glutathione peroxidase